MTISFSCDIIHKRALRKAQFGGLAQLARAPGSYPVGRWFKSDIRYQNRPVGQEVKTRPFHGCNMGSIPVRVTIEKRTPASVSFFLFYGDPCEESHPATNVAGYCRSRLCERSRAAWCCCKFHLLAWQDTASGMRNTTPPLPCGSLVRQEIPVRFCFLFTPRRVLCEELHLSICRFFRTTLAPRARSLYPPPS